MLLILLFFLAFFLYFYQCIFVKFLIYCIIQLVFQFLNSDCFIISISIWVTASAQHTLPLVDCTKIHLLICISSTKPALTRKYTIVFLQILKSRTYVKVFFKQKSFLNFTFNNLFQPKLSAKEQCGIKWK